MLGEEVGGGFGGGLGSVNAKDGGAVAYVERVVGCVKDLGTFMRAGGGSG